MNIGQPQYVGTNDNNGSNLTSNLVTTPLYKQTITFGIDPFTGSFRNTTTDVYNVSCNEQPNRIVIRQEFYFKETVLDRYFKGKEVLMAIFIPRQEIARMNIDMGGAFSSGSPISTFNSGGMVNIIPTPRGFILEYDLCISTKKGNYPTNRYPYEIFGRVLLPDFVLYLPNFGDFPTAPIRDILDRHFSFTVSGIGDSTYTNSIESANMLGTDFQSYGGPYKLQVDKFPEYSKSTTKYDLQLTDVFQGLKVTSHTAVLDNLTKLENLDAPIEGYSLPHNNHSGSENGIRYYSTRPSSKVSDDVTKKKSFQGLSDIINKLTRRKQHENK